VFLQVCSSITVLQQASPGGNVEVVGSGLLTLREQQVLQLRREMLHPGGVRLQLRRKDCTGSIALVDAFGAVWYVETCATLYLHFQNVCDHTWRLFRKFPDCVCNL
jgi:hypothetical protein